jgi:hypothetical protein
MTTLRDMLITPLPSLDDPEYTRSDEGHFVQDANWLQTRTMLADAAAYIATSYASSIEYTSDSTIDTHLAMIATLTNLNNVIYAHDQTMEFDEALTAFLDDDDAAIDFYMATYDANTSGPDMPMPTFMTHFNPDSDGLYED